MPNVHVVRVTDRAEIHLRVSAQADGRFYWQAKAHASQRATSLPFHRYASAAVTAARQDGIAETVAAAVHAAHAAAHAMRDALLREYAALDAQLAIDAANVAAAEDAFPAPAPAPAPPAQEDPLADAV